MTLRLPSALPSFPIDTPHGEGDPVSDLARKVFGFADIQVDDDGRVRIAREIGTAREVEFDRRTFSVWMADWDRLWIPGAQPTLPSPERALALAQDFMTKNHLLPTERLFPDYKVVVGDPVAARTVKRLADGTEGCLDVFVGFPVSVELERVRYPVLGCGAKWAVTFGHKESIVNCLVGLFQGLSPTPADPPLQPPQVPFSDADNVEISLVFERWSDVHGAEWLLPMYFVRRSGGPAPFWRRYPATPTAKAILEARNAAQYVRLSSVPAVLADIRAELGPTDRLGATWTVDTEEEPTRLRQTAAFVDALRAQHWTMQSYVEKSALEEHWNAKRAAYVEQADISYYCGHASARSWQLTAPADNALTEVDVKGGLGGGFLKWIFIDACGPLQDRMINCDEDTRASDRWAAMFNGLRGLCGFATTVIPTEVEGAVFGRTLARRPVIQAWLRAGRECQPFVSGGKMTRDGITVWAGVILPDEGAASTARIGESGHARNGPQRLMSLWTPV